MSSCINEEPLSSPVNNSGEGNISFTLGGSAGAKALTRGETPTAQDCEKHIDHLHVVAFKNGLLTAVVKDVVPDQDNNCVANVGGSGTMDIYFIANADADLAALIEALTVGTSTPADLEALIATQSPGEYEASDYTGKFLMVGMVGSVTVQASGATSTNIGTINLTRLAARIDIAAMPEGFTISSVQVCNYYTKSLLMRDGNTATMPEALGSPTDMTAVSLTNGDLPYTGRFFVYEDPTSQLEVVITGTYASKDVTAVVSFAAPSGGGAAAPIKRNSIYTISLAASSETSTVAELEGSITVKDWDEGATVTAQNSAIISNNAAPTAVAFDNLSNCTETSGTLNVTAAETAVSFDVVVTNASKGNISKLVCKYPVTGKGITISGGDFAADGVTQTFTVNITAACASDPYILEAQNVLKNTASLAIYINDPDPGVDFANVTSTHKGWYIAQNGKAYQTMALAQQFSGSAAVGYICYAGAVDKYFDKFIAIALHNAHTTYTTWSDALSKVNTYASTNAITVGSTTYNTNAPGTSTYYDQVTDGTGTSSASRTGSIVKGWRLPSVTDWRYIFAGLGGLSATSPAGVGAGGSYPYGTGSTLLSAINTACDNTELQSSYYWSSSELSSDSDYAWLYSFNSSYFYNHYKTDNSYVRAVFAY
jgi:hypothetical protein